METESGSEQPSPFSYYQDDKQLLIVVNDPNMRQYDDYFYRLDGKLDEEKYGIPVWEFPVSKEKKVFEKINEILTGQLPPPSELPVPEFDVNAEEGVYTTENPESVSFKAKPKKERKVKVKKEKTEIQEPKIPPVEETINYNPLAKERGETEEQYTRRKYIYESLLTLDIGNNEYFTPEYADVLSRMRNNVDFLNILYEKDAMNILNTFIPTK
ncbi:MAG: hypothetical protein QW478_01470 [Candidatus Micrarchaeaceae archaeon]